MPQDQGWEWEHSSSQLSSSLVIALGLRELPHLEPMAPSLGGSLRPVTGRYFPFVGDISKGPTQLRAPAGDMLRPPYAQSSCLSALTGVASENTPQETSCVRLSGTKCVSQGPAEDRKRWAGTCTEADGLHHPTLPTCPPGPDPSPATPCKGPAPSTSREGNGPLGEAVCFLRMRSYQRL